MYSEQEFKMACQSMKDVFPIFASVIGEELRAKVFTHDADVPKLQAQYAFLNTLQQRIINEQEI